MYIASKVSKSHYITEVIYLQNIVYIVVNEWLK